MADQFLPARKLPIPKHLGDISPLQYLEHLISIKHKYHDLATVHIVDFYTKNYWDLIDPEWQKALMQADSDDDEFIDTCLNLASNYDCKSHWPDSLKAYVKEMKDNQLPMFDDTEYNCDHLQCTIERHLQTGMNDKKAHEVESLSMLIQHIAKSTDMTSIIDLGAGQGYLSRALALQHDMHVLAVDADEIQTCGAKFFQNKAEKSIKGKKIRAIVATEPEAAELIEQVKNGQHSRLHHITQMITLDNLPTLLADWTDTSRWKHREVPAKSWMICGLHTCGDLAPTMLQLYQGSPQIGGMISVGCCYHWLTEYNANHPEVAPGFPMSSYLQDHEIKLGSTLRMLACQAPGRWASQRESTLSSFKHNLYRAMLQRMMVDKGLASVEKPPVVGRMNNKRDFTSYSVYVRAALKRFKMTGAISDEEAEQFEKNAREKQLDRQIIILWTLRILLSPIIETIILVDRYMYLLETLPDTHIWMWPLFDKVASPRNVVIVGLKKL